MGWLRSIPCCWRDELHSQAASAEGTPSPRPCERSSIPGCTMEFVLGWEAEMLGLSFSVFSYIFHRPGCFLMFRALWLFFLILFLDVPQCQLQPWFGVVGQVSPGEPRGHQGSFSHGLNWWEQHLRVSHLSLEPLQVWEWLGNSWRWGMQSITYAKHQYLFQIHFYKLKFCRQMPAMQSGFPVQRYKGFPTQEWHLKGIWLFCQHPVWTQTATWQLEMETEF